MYHKSYYFHHARKYQTISAYLIFISDFGFKLFLTTRILN